jgi:uncharacterized protein
MCREIATIGKVLVRRPDRDELMEIRNGAWTYEQVVSFMEKEDKALEEIYATSKVIPKSPDMNFLDSLCIQLTEMGMKQ